MPKAHAHANVRNASAGQGTTPTPRRCGAPRNRARAPHLPGAVPDSLPEEDGVAVYAKASSCATPLAVGDSVDFQMVADPRGRDPVATEIVKVDDGASRAGVVDWWQFDSGFIRPSGAPEDSDRALVYFSAPDAAEGLQPGDEVSFELTVQKVGAKAKAVAVERA